jgi:4'-phosphopantetheinyl transferase
VRPVVNAEQIAQRFFSHREIAALGALPPPIRIQAFFTCWTRKEAYIKARGEGLSFALDKFVVSLAPGEPATLLSAPEGPQETSRWALLELEPEPGYAAALAVEGNGWRVSYWDWECELNGQGTRRCGRSAPSEMGPGGL